MPLLLSVHLKNNNIDYLIIIKYKIIYKEVISRRRSNMLLYSINNFVIKNNNYRYSKKLYIKASLLSNKVYKYSFRPHD